MSRRHLKITYSPIGAAAPLPVRNDGGALPDRTSTRGSRDALIAPVAPLFDIPTVARRLGVCEKTVRRFITRGELHAYRIGRQLRISEEELLRFLELCR